MLLFLYLLYVIIIIIIIFTCCLCKSLCLLKALTSSFVKPLETTQNLCQRFRLLPGSLPSILDLIPKIWFLWFTPPYSILDFYFLSIHVLSIHLVFLALIFFSLHSSFLIFLLGSVVKQQCVSKLYSASFLGPLLKLRH